MPELLKKAYAFSFFWMFLLILPVMIPFYQSLGLSMERIFQLQAIFGLCVMLFEIPTGYLCDLFGRKKVLCIGAVFNGVGFTFLLTCKNFEQLVIFEIILALGMSLVSGADLSIIYDAIESADGNRSQKTHALANFQLAQVSGESIAALLGGILAALSFRYMIFANFLTSWVPLMIALSFKEPKYKKMEGTNHWNNLTGVVKHILGADPILRLIFLNLLCWGLSTFFVVWIFQKYWQVNGISLVWFGAIWAAFNFSAGLVGKQVHWLERRFGFTRLLLFLSAAPIVAYFAMAFFGGWAGVISGVLFYFSRGVTQVLLREAYHARIPSEFRATANSIQTGSFRLIFAIFGPMVGYFIDRSGVAATLGGLGVGFLVLFFLLVPALIRALYPKTLLANS